MTYATRKVYDRHTPGAVEKYCEECGRPYYTLAQCAARARYCIECSTIKSRERSADYEDEKPPKEPVLKFQYWRALGLRLIQDAAPEDRAFRPGSLHSRARVKQEIPMGVWANGTVFVDVYTGERWTINKSRLVREG